MSKGTVKWFDTHKGYGFIEPDEGGKDAFVHISAVRAAGLDELVEGQRVDYEMEAQEDGRKCAENISVVE